MPLDNYTRETQEELAAACRNGQVAKIKALPEERARVYRDLVRNGIEDTLKRAYPIAHSKLTALGLWDTLVDRFIAEGSLDAPELWRMPQRFLKFARGEKWSEIYDLPYLNDLLEFEWCEIEIFMMPDLIDQDTPAPQGSEFLKLNPEHRLLFLNYPVFHPIHDNEYEPGQFYLLAFRHPETRLIKFVELPSYFAALLKEMGDHAQTREEIASKAAAVSVETNQTVEFSEEKNSGILKQINVFIDQAVEEGFICNTVRG